MKFRRSLPAFLFVCGISLPASAQPSPPPDALDRYQSGRTNYQVGNYESALADFEASMKAYQSPNTRLYLARALRELGRLPEAAEAFERAMDEAQKLRESTPSYAQTEDAARAELREVARRVAWLRVHIEVPQGTIRRAEITFDSSAPRELLNGSSRMAVKTGRVHATVTAVGYETASRDLTLSAGDEKEVRFELVPIAQEPKRELPSHASSTPPLFWIGGAVAIVGGASAIAFRVASDGEYNYLDANCRSSFSGACASSRSSGLTYEALSYLGLGVFVAGTATAIIAFAVHSKSPRAKANPFVLEF